MGFLDFFRKKKEEQAIVYDNEPSVSAEDDKALPGMSAEDSAEEIRTDVTAGDLGAAESAE